MVQWDARRTGGSSWILHMTFDLGGCVLFQHVLYLLFSYCTCLTNPILLLLRLSLVGTDPTSYTSSSNPLRFHAKSIASSWRCRRPRCSFVLSSTRQTAPISGAMLGKPLQMNAGWKLGRGWRSTSTMIVQTSWCTAILLAAPVQLLWTTTLSPTVVESNSSVS